MIHPAAAVQEQMVNPVKVAIHTQEEEQQGPMAQEEEHPSTRRTASRRYSTVTSRDTSTRSTFRSMGSIGQI